MKEIKVEVPEELEKKMEKFKWVDWSKMVAKSLQEKVEDLEEFERERKVAISDSSDEREVKESLAREVVKSCEETDKSKKSMSVEEFNKWCDEL